MAIQDGALRTEIEKGTNVGTYDGALRTEAEKEDVGTTTTTTTTTASTSSSTSSSTTSSTTASTSSSTSTTTSTTSSTTTTATASTSSSSTSSSSTTTTTGPPPPGWTWGEASPSPEASVIWDNWAIWPGGGAARFTSSYGVLQLQSGEDFVSDVRDFVNTALKCIYVSFDDYASGFGGGTIHVRGQAASFGQLDGSPSWQVYTVPFNTTWRYVQVRVVA